MQETFRALIAEMGGKAVQPMPTKEQGYGIADGGRSSTSWAARAWAAIPKTSVVNANCQAHDVKNLFVADGGPFVSQADKNPTWTILALSLANERLHRASSERRGRYERRRHGGRRLQIVTRCTVRPALGRMAAASSRQPVH